MPYIKQEKRDSILVKRATPQGWEKSIALSHIESAGDLNFAITAMILQCYSNSDKRYQVINDIIGALEGAKNEFYRRVAAPYEDAKIKENGDVYP